jgi:2',3'-cyclic-nucleotide 2'-phosphodiesterase (5'-nucleotidase family)
LVTSETGTSEKINKLIEPYKLGMSEAMNEVIGFCPAFIEKKKPSSAIGSMMADAVMDAINGIEKDVTFCLLNYGGIRSSLDSGAITVGEIFQIMPFENEIVVLKLESPYLDTLKYFVKRKNGESLSDEVRSLDTDKIYEKGFFYLVTNDYIANGGDNYSFLKNAVERESTGIKIREAIIGHVKRNNPLVLDYKKRAL